MNPYIWVMWYYAQLGNGVYIHYVAIIGHYSFTGEARLVHARL